LGRGGEGENYPSARATAVASAASAEEVGRRGAGGNPPRRRRQEGAAEAEEAARGPRRGGDHGGVERRRGPPGGGGGGDGGFATRGEGRERCGRWAACGLPTGKKGKNKINKIVVLLPTRFYFAGLTVRADLTGCYADVASSVWAACGNPTKLGPVFRLRKF
jgi:hypothetical protein